MGKKALEAGDYGIESFTKAHDLIQQGLLACLDYKTGGEVAQSLGAVYALTSGYIPCSFSSPHGQTCD
jgi:flagellin-specific chaperone FliS